MPHHDEVGLLLKEPSLGEIALVLVRQNEESCLFGGEVLSMQGMLSNVDGNSQDTEFLERVKLDSVNRRLISVRIPAGHTKTVFALESLGFRHMELTMHPHLKMERLVESQSFEDCSHIIVSQVPPSEVESVAARASNLFSHTRWHSDPNISNHLANRRIAAWIRDSKNHSSKVLLQATDRRYETPLGFFLVRRDEKNNSFWELTAMFEEHRGKGLAIQVWKAFLQFELESGTRQVSTNFNAVNLPLYSLYGKLGFRLLEPSIALHLFSDPEAPQLRAWG